MLELDNVLMDKRVSKQYCKSSGIEVNTRMNNNPHRVIHDIFLSYANDPKGKFFDTAQKRMKNKKKMSLGNTT